MYWTPFSSAGPNGPTEWAQIKSCFMEMDITAVDGGGHLLRTNTLLCRGSWHVQKIIVRTDLAASAKALVRWTTGKRLTDCLLKLSLITFPPWNGGIFRSRPDIRDDVSPTRGSNFWGPRESI